MSVAISADGKRVVSGSDDNTVRQWDAESGACLRVFTGHTGWINQAQIWGAYPGEAIKD